MFNAIRRQRIPRHLSTDHDPAFEAHRWMANLRILEIDEIKTVPYVPLSHPFVERLIGTVRREFLDHVLFWNSSDLERKLAAFQVYYNTARSHASLEGYAPLSFAARRRVAPADLRHVRWVSHCGNLVQPTAIRSRLAIESPRRRSSAASITNTVLSGRLREIRASIVSADHRQRVHGASVPESVRQCKARRFDRAPSDYAELQIAYDSVKAAHRRVIRSA